MKHNATPLCKCLPLSFSLSLFLPLSFSLSLLPSLPFPVLTLSPILSFYRLLSSLSPSQFCLFPSFKFLSYSPSLISRFASYTLHLSFCSLSLSLCIPNLLFYLNTKDMRQTKNKRERHTIFLMFAYHCPPSLSLLLLPPLSISPSFTISCLLSPLLSSLP